MHPGGGGINVARAICELRGNPLVVAALGGHVGSIVADALTDRGFSLQRVRVRGPPGCRRWTWVSPREPPRCSLRERPYACSLMLFGCSPRPPWAGGVWMIAMGQRAWWMAWLLVDPRSAARKAL